MNTPTCADWYDGKIRAAVPRCIWISVCVTGVLVLCLLTAAPAMAQNYTTMIGTPNFSTNIPVQLGYVDAANGDLHIEIPLGTFKERGKTTFAARLVYDSRIWQDQSNLWEPNNVPNETASYNWSGWRLVMDYLESGGAVNSQVTNGVCLNRYGQVIGTFTILDFFTYTSADGTLHQFPTSMMTKQGSGSGTACRSGSSTASGYATDSSGYYLSITNYADSNVWNKNGTLMQSDTSINFPEDSNGNYFTPQWVSGYEHVVDTLGRTPVAVSSSGNSIYYDVSNAQGGTSRYTVTTESIPVHTAFGKSGVTEYSGNITVWKSIELPDNTTSYQFSYDSGSTSGHYGELTGITLPTGGQLSYSYGNFTDSSGNENSWLESWSNGTGTWSLTPSASSGSNQVTFKKPSNEQVIYTFNIVNPGAWDTQEKYESSSGTVLRTVALTWNTASQVKTDETVTDYVPGGGGINRTTEWSNYDSYGDPGTISEWKYYSGGLPSSADRVTTITYTNYSAGQPVGLPSSITVQAGGTTVAQTNITYDSTTLTSKTGIAHHDDTNFGTGNTARGNPTIIQRLISGSTYSSTTLDYDTTGQPISVTDQNNNATSLSYTDNFYTDNNANPPASYSPPAPTNAYLTQATLPIIGGETFGYYYGSGQLAYFDDQNGQIIYNHFYDEFDRPTETILPSGWNLIAYPSSTEIDSYLGITDSSPSTSCSSCRHDETLLDTLGRVTDSYLVNDPDGETTAEKTYDSNSRVNKTTYPYRGSANGDDSFTYDGLDRATQITHADNTSSAVAYGAAVGGTGVNTTQLCSASTYGLGYPSLFTDESGKMREIWTDGFGRTIEVDEPNSSGSLVENSCYAYDANNNLTEVVSPTGQTRTYQYDDLSRVTSVSTPETHVGGTQYSTTYSYTSSGSPCSGDPTEVCSRTDPRGISTTYSYDGLNRLAKITYSDSTPTVTYCYDGSNSSCISGGYSSSNGKGRRTAMSDGSGNTGWSYDAMGRIVTEQGTIEGVTKTISYSYNGDGSLASVTYPSGRTVTYSVGNAERTISAIDSNGSQYAVTASYSPAGALAGVIYGKVSGGFGGITEARQYNNRLETTSISASSSNGTALNLAPCYNSFSFSSGCSSSVSGNNGSVTGITNGVDTGETQSFTYDTLNRISSAATQATSGSDCWGQNFGPDAVANLTSINMTQCTIGSLSVTTDGYNHLSGTGFSYDHAGDMTSDASYSYTFDAENRITTANGWTYVYDGNGLRVAKKVSGSVSVIYWRSFTGDVLEETGSTGTLNDDYVYFAGRKITAIDNNGTVNYYYSDALGTIHTITDSTGHACFDADFTPYGEEVLNPNVTQSCSSRYEFAGYEYDSETGLYYAKGRFYNLLLGRFMSAHALGGISSGPQTWNGYAYAVNDPEDTGSPVGLIQVPEIQLLVWTNSEGSSVFVNQSLKEWQLAVQNAKGSVEELKARYFQKKTVANPYGSAPQQVCLFFGSCPASPSAAKIEIDYSRPLEGFQLKFQYWNSDTYYDYHRMNQLASGGSFFSSSWDSNLGYSFYDWLVTPQIPLKIPYNPDSATNDSLSNYLDPFFPSFDFKLFFGGGGGSSNECGIGGWNDMCSL